MVTRNRLGAQSIDSPQASTNNTPTDNRTPAAPPTLSASTSIEYNPGGYYLVAVTLTWKVPTVASDGTAMTPASMQVYEVRSPETVYTLVKTVEGATVTTLTLHGYAPGETWIFKVRAASAKGKLSAFSPTVTVVMPTTAPPPPPPSAPDLYSRMGTVQITWDGRASGGGPMPPDVAFVRVYRGTGAFADAHQVAGLFGAGSTSDGPLVVDGTLQLYWLAAVNLIGIEGDPSSVAGIIVNGIAGPDIPDGLIDANKMTTALNAAIQTAIDHTTGGTIPGNRISTGPTQPVGTTDDPLRDGDLWFDPNDGYRPYTYDAINHVFVTVRDATLTAAFTGGLLNGSFLDAPLIRSKFLSVGLIDAGDILVSGSVSASSGVIGSIDAGKITVGELDGNIISTGSINSKSLLLADLTNLVTEPGFDQGGGAWSTSGLTNTTAVVKAVADHPVSGAAGHVLSVTGAGLTRDTANIQVVPTEDTTELHIEVWVRKMVNTTTGTADIVLLAKRKNLPDTVLTVASQQFTTGNIAAGTWVKLIADVSPPPPPPPPDPLPQPGDRGYPYIPPAAGSATRPYPLAGIYQVTLALRVRADAVAGEFQFASPTLRRKNNASLFVDGSVTARSLDVGAVTAISIGANQIQAMHIDAGSITYGMLDGQIIHADNIVAGALNTQVITLTQPGGAIYTDATYPRLEISNTLGIAYWASKSATDHTQGDPLFHLDPTSGNGGTNMYWRSSAGFPRWQLDASGFRIWGSTGPPSVYLQATGDASFSGTVTASTVSASTLLGNSISTASSATSAGARVMINSAGLTMYDSTNKPAFQFTNSTGGLLLTSKPGHDNDFTTGWVLKETGMFFYNNGALTIGLYANDGDANFKGDLTGSTMTAGSITGTSITGNTVRTSTSHPLIEMLTVAGPPAYEEFAMTNSAGSAHVMFRTAQTGPTADARIILDTDPTNSGGPRFQFDSISGLFWYKNPTTLGLAMRFSDGSLTLTGPIISSGTITGASFTTNGTYPKAVMDPNNGIRLYIDSTPTYSFYATMAGTAFFSGTVTASDIYTGTLHATTVNAGTISGGTYSGLPTITGPTINTPTITTPTITTPTITVGGGILRTSTGSNRVEMSSDQIRFYTLVGSTTTLAGIISADPSGTALIMRGNTAGGEAVLGDDNQLIITNTYELLLGTSVTVSGGSLLSISPGSSTSPGVVGRIASSERYKQKIAPMDLDPGFMAVRPSTWRDRPSSAAMMQRLAAPKNSQFYGFTAENMHESGLAGTVIYDGHQRPDSIHFLAVLAHTVRYTQHLVRQVEELSARMAELEGAL